MRRQGLIRLWVVLSIIFVPTVAMLNFESEQAPWAAIDKMITSRCVDNEFNLPSHPDAIECEKREGAYQSLFAREHITPASYWANSLFWSFVLDIIVTALIVGIALVIRWIVQGFRPVASMVEAAPSEGDTSYRDYGSR